MNKDITTSLRSSLLINIFLATLSFLVIRGYLINFSSYVPLSICLIVFPVMFMQEIEQWSQENQVG